MNERFQISLEAAHELLHSLKYPDYSAIESRERTLQNIQDTMTITHCHGQDVIDIPSLDLTFLEGKDVKRNDYTTNQFEVSNNEIVSLSTERNNGAVSNVFYSDDNTPEAA